MDEMAAAVTRIREAKAELQRERDALDEWRAHRDDRAPRIRVMDIDNFRTAVGIVPTVEYSGQENIRKGRLLALEAAVDESREALRKLKMENPVGQRVHFGLADCLLRDGGIVRHRGSANGTVSAMCGPYAEISLAEPLDLHEPEKREVKSVFARLIALQFYLGE